MDKYGIIGHPLGHSFSPGFFNEKFRNESIDAVYEMFDLPQIEAVIEVLTSNPEASRVECHHTVQAADNAVS